eukprot:TRINITY_DN33695_c0_g1_i1.p1 TRINITY_DN33695_c0_g1~~TRINITY_DN33695_c0_g1_i1.p1  ORF type:complete len:358 (-),score=68.79 TRINITY_DN33695_c0_g1_i1:227-1225(-)
MYPRARQAQSQLAGLATLAQGQYVGLRDQDGVRDGWGVMHRRDGTTYAGQWISGRREGAGTLVFDGGIFEGQWARGEANGQGQVKFSNGDSFEGQYVGNRKHGHGRYTWADGAEEEGEYFDGRKTDWHLWSRGATMWKMRYEAGVVIEAKQVRKLDQERELKVIASPGRFYPRAQKQAAKESRRQETRRASKGKQPPARGQRISSKEALKPSSRAVPGTGVEVLGQDLRPQPSFKGQRTSTKEAAKPSSRSVPETGVEALGQEAPKPPSTSVPGTGAEDEHRDEVLDEDLRAQQKREPHPGAASVQSSGDAGADPVSGQDRRRSQVTPEGLE